MEFTDRPLWFCYKAKDSDFEDILVLLLCPYLLSEGLPFWCPTLASAIFIHYITPWVPFIISKIIKDVEKFWQGAFRFFYSIRIGYLIILLGIVRNKSSVPEPTFQYSDLAEGYIRLLGIQGIKSARHVFNLKLCDFPLHELPPYYAVSYTWDNQPNSHLISISNQWLSASSNVSSILSLFAPSVFGQRYLWIDAIRINQTNKVEKATQVKLMRDIYRNAKSVLVWLSSENLNQDNQRHNQYILSISTRQLYDTCQDLFNRVMPLEWTNLDGVLVHRYWRRAWIIQEFVVSRQLEVYFRATCSAQSSLPYVHNTELFDTIAAITCEIDHDSWKDSDWYSSQAPWFNQLCNIVQDQLSVLRGDQLDDNGFYSRDYRRCPGRWRGAICRTLLAIPDSYWGQVPGNSGTRTFIRPDELTEEQLSDWTSGEAKSPLYHEPFDRRAEDDKLYEALEFLSQLPRF